MTLEKADLTAIEQIVDKAFKPIGFRLETIDQRIDRIEQRIDKMEYRLNQIEDKLDRIEKWLPLDNTYIIGPLRKHVIR